MTIAIERQGMSGRVDAEARVIRGVKVCGLQSRNTARVLGLTAEEYGAAIDEPYSYDEQALIRAIPLYENASVYDGHLPMTVDDEGRRVFKSLTHENKDLVGWLRNVRFIRGRGLFGDLHYISAHPLSSVLAEVAERAENKFALSHEARFSRAELRNGRVVLTGIDAVDGVAIVNNQPGTTNGLFETVADTYSRPGALAEALFRGGPEVVYSPSFSETGSLARALRHWGAK